MHSYGPVMLRVCVGAVFVAHGLQKLLGMWGGPGLDGTAGMVAALGLPYPYPLGVMLAAVEAGGGILLILGGLTRWAALALAVDMAVAIWKVHYANGFFLNGQRGDGIEFTLVLLGALLSLMLTGAGALSIEQWRSQSAEAAARGRARARKV